MRVFISCETSLQKPMPSIVPSAPRGRNENKSDPPVPVAGRYDDPGRVRLGYNTRAFQRRIANRKMRNAFRISLLVVLALITTSAFAHHSRSMFDQTRQVTLVGRVKEFQWTNPHCWIQVLVADPSNPGAEPVEWGVEMGAPVEVMRKGWKPGSLKPGDQVTIVVSPLRDGQHGGLVVSVTGPDGKIIGRPAETPK